MGGKFYRVAAENKFLITISHFFTSRELDFFDIDASGNFPKNVNRLSPNRLSESYFELLMGEQILGYLLRYQLFAVILL